jgi:hypothetical protein
MANSRNKASSQRIGPNHTLIAPLEKRPALADIAAMSQPIEVDLPHQLGKDEARRRIANNIHRLEEHIPGKARVESGWAGDQLNLKVEALGDAVQATIDVEETKVRVKVLLPGLLAMFAAPIQAALQKKGNVLLEDHRK